jgi:hypothetical protein
LFSLISVNSAGMKKLRQILSFFYALSAFIFNTSCKSPGEYKSPEGYDLNHPVKVILGSELEEISGINYYPKDTGIFAISDATGSLFKIFPDRNTMVQKWKFGKPEDFEDLLLYDSIFYILASKGDIVAVKFVARNSLETTTFKFPHKKSEFETLYFDSSLNKLILICKDCKEDKKNEVSTFSFDISTQTFSNGPFKIDAGKIASMLHENKIKFRSSGATVNPLTHELFILSSVNKAVVIADRNGVVKNIYDLDPSIYKQPEGIAFTPAGDLLISNESADEGAANILVIKFKRKSR